MVANTRVKFYFLLLIGFNVVLFLPMIGHGFVLDDFMLLATLAFHHFSFGLTHAHERLPYPGIRDGAVN